MNEKTKIRVSSVTYAIKGRDLLRSRGFSAYMERTKGFADGTGCGYHIVVSKNGAQAEAILREHGIKIVGIAAGEAS